MEISRRLRNLLMDHLAGASVLREIESEFEAADIAPGAPPEENGFALGQRRTLVQTYYNGLDFSAPADIRKFLNVLSVFMANLERQLSTAAPWASQTDDPYARQQFDKFQQQLGRDGYEYRGGVIVPLTAAARLADAKAIAEQFDAAHITDQIKRIEASIDADPALAIGTAKELVESCFKTILRERNIEYGKEDLPQLGKKAFSAMKLLPEDVPDSAKGAKTIKVLLSNLATVVQGLAEIRSLYGTGHGRDGKARGVTSRHARLAVGAASALVTFAFQTHLENPPEG
jgi:Abortive infection C-terminus